VGLEIDVMIGVKNVATVKPLAETYAMEWQLRFSDEHPAVPIFVATLDHCLVDLLHREFPSRARSACPGTRDEVGDTPHQTLAIGTFHQECGGSSRSFTLVRHCSVPARAQPVRALSIP
jgi:hypothetical protein